METIILLKEIYIEGFKNIGHYLLKNYLKVFAWFNFVLLFIVLYAFAFRISSGFAFD